MLFKKEEKSSETFWMEYEEKTGEKVLARGLGKYVSGWDEFDDIKQDGLWGLVVSTSGGFRFHHFPQKSWIDTFTAFAKTDTPKEKSIFIPKEKIILTETAKETSWWKRVFSSTLPRLVIRYLDDAGNEKQLFFEAEYRGGF